MFFTCENNSGHIAAHASLSAAAMYLATVPACGYILGNMNGALAEGLRMAAGELPGFLARLADAVDLYNSTH